MRETIDHSTQALLPDFACACPGLQIRRIESGNRWGPEEATFAVKSALIETLLCRSWS
jgi:hypothetical protein